MSQALEILDSLSLKELRRLLSLKENQNEVVDLMARRDQRLEEARLLQQRIDELVSGTSGRSPRKRQGPSVRALCEEILRKKSPGLTPAEVKDAILEKYPHRNNKTFYNQVFIALTRNDGFRKMINGTFRLKKTKAR